MSTRAVRRHHRKRVADARRRFDRAGRSDNELATRHPLDCGRRCMLCHWEKLLCGGSRRARSRQGIADGWVED